MSKQWFILSTMTGSEAKVARALNNWRKSNKEDGHEYVGEVLVPEVKEHAINDSGVETTHWRVVFPGYVFAELDVFADFMKGEKRKAIWDAVCKIDGMIGFLGGDNPRPMSEDEIASVRKYLEQKEEKNVSFKEGDSVKILDGAFAGNIGTIAKKNDAEQIALVEFKMFDQDMNTEVSYGSLEFAE